MNLCQRYDGVLFALEGPVRLNISEDISPQSLRHCSYYLSHNLMSGEMELLDVNLFLDPAPNDSSNVTGQKYIMEGVSGVVNDLSKVSTESLVGELKSRRDNPFSSTMLEGKEDNVFLREYQAGYYETHLRYDNNEEDTTFTPVRTFNDLEEATLYSQFHEFRGRPLSVIMHLVIKMDTDIGI